MSIKYKTAEILVLLANKLTNKPDSPRHVPLFRPVDQLMPGIGHKYACGAYSYEGLKSLVEQDGPDGFGASCTVAWLIGEEGWQDVADMNPTDLRRTLAMSGLDMEDSDD